MVAVRFAPQMLGLRRTPLAVLPQEQRTRPGIAVTRLPRQARITEDDTIDSAFSALGVCGCLSTIAALVGIACALLR